MVIIASDQQVFPTPWWQGKCPDAPACACSEGWRWRWWWRHALSCYSVARWHVEKQCMLGAGGFAGNSSTARSSVEEILNETSTLHCFSLFCSTFCRPLSVWACWAWRWTLQRIDGLQCSIENEKLEIRMHWGLSRASPVKKLTGLTLGWTQFATLWSWILFIPSQEVMALIRAHCQLHQK